MDLLVFYFIYCFTCVLLALTPGPDNLAAITIASTHGRRAGVYFVFGLCCGLLGHTLLVVTGLAVLIVQHTWLLFLLKLLGAVYLVYLAWQSLIASKQIQALSDAALGDQNVFKKGIFMSLSNPKLLLFFLAFLPQFLRPDAFGVLNEFSQLLMLAGLFIFVSLVVFLSLVYLVDWLQSTLLGTDKQQTVLVRLHYLAAIIFMCLAVKLVFI